MTNLLDIDTLHQLYPQAESRRTFLARARSIVQADRAALQQAMHRHAYTAARDVSHRLHGTSAFLAGSTEIPLKTFDDLNMALHRGDHAAVDAAQSCVLDYLTQLEEQLGRALD